MVLRYAGIVAALLLVLVPLQSSFAHSEDENLIGYPIFTGNRFHIFEDNKVDFCIYSNNNHTYNNLAVKAVNEWKKNLIEVTGNEKVWNMKTHVEPKNSKMCDGFINFYKTPNDIRHQIYGVAGFSNPYTATANVTVYTDFYQETLRNITENQWNEMTIEKFQDIVKNNTHATLDYDKLYRITLHELGHAFSLNHPKSAQYGTLDKAKGIMSYNPDETKILAEEVRQVVKAYPNGFTNQKSATFSSLDKVDETNSFYVGERANLIIQSPYKEKSVPIDSISIYIFPEGKESNQKYQNAPVKLVKDHGKNYLLNNGGYFEYIKAIPVNWVNDKFVMTVHFVPEKEMETADITVIIKNHAGFGNQWEIKDAFNVKNALFSDILLEDTDYQWAWKTAIGNKNDS